MTARVAIVTGELRGLGRAMTLGLARTGVRVLAVGHIGSDVADMQAPLQAVGQADRVACLTADIRKPAECDRVLAACIDRFGQVDILVNSAGLTFTYIWPDRFRRDQPYKFWEATDEVIQAVMDTNYVAADQMARRVAPRLVAQGWGRIVNVTTKLDTMNRPGTTPYGASKAGWRWRPRSGPRNSPAPARPPTSSIPAPARTRPAWRRRCATGAARAAWHAWWSRAKWCRRCCSSCHPKPTR